MDLTDNVIEEVQKKEGLIASFLDTLPEKALNLGIRIGLALVFFFIGMQLIRLIRKIIRKSMNRAGAEIGVIQFVDSFVKASLNCGQVRGPVQLGFARSIDPVISQEVTITRVAITTEKDAENKSTEMGRKSIVPYALYRAEGFISANLARKTTGFTEEDLELLWDAIINMFENDHSAARGKMSVRELIVFKHSKELGDCPAYKLFDAVEVTRKENVEYPRRYQDYTVEIHNDKIPESVEVKRMI